MWVELSKDDDVSGGVRSEDGGLPAQPAVVKEYGRFAYLEGRKKKGDSPILMRQFKLNLCFSIQVKSIECTTHTMCTSTPPLLSSCCGPN